MQRNEGHLSIGEVSKITGAHVKSLRYYDAIGILKPAYVNAETGYRYYAAAQLYIVEAIQLCLDLGVPLKEFTRFIDAQGHLHYDALLAHGQAIAERRMRALGRSMQLISRAQAEIEASTAHAGARDFYRRAFPEMRVLLVPLEPDGDSFAHHAQIHKLYRAYHDEDAFALGYTAGYLYDIAGGRVCRHYFVEVIQAPQDLPDTRVLPRGERVCRLADTPQIERAATLLAPFLAEGDAYTVIESELMTRDLDIHRRTIELSLLR